MCSQLRGSLRHSGNTPVSIHNDNAGEAFVLPDSGETGIIARPVVMVESTALHNTAVASHRIITTAHSTKTTLDRHLMHGSGDLKGKQEEEAKTRAKTYNSGYSLVVTHLTTNPPVRCLNRAERTGSLVLNVLWSYVKYSV